VSALGAREKDDMSAIEIISLLLLVGALASLGVLSFRFIQIKALLSEERLRSRLLEERLSDQAKQEETLRAAARIEFSSLASAMMERESKIFQESSEKSLERLLVPMKERLKDFEKKVDESYQAEGRERHVLKSEVEKLIQLNDRMTRETTNLTQALKGDSKFQGDWGELVLENILSTAGLREGQEYLLQETLTSDDGKVFRPDVLIKLPDDKQIIVDSKVSLKAYEAYCSTEVPEERERYLHAHIESIAKHMNELSDKHYSKLKGIKSPEFVFLFTPIEPAYVLAMRNDPDLANRAWKKGVAIVTATTLFTSLKTVASIWRLENQNRNAQEIAEEAAKLYDKFVGFYDDFESVGKTLERGASQYSEAKRKLREGPGNVMGKIEKLRELGAAPKNRIRPDLLE
jgi:DNA recombination protein RmuC